MQKKDWRYKVGGGLGGLIPSLLLLVLFGGVSWWLYQNNNGAFLFTAILTALAGVILIAVFYRALFVKVLIYDDGFYRSTKPWKGKFYAYEEIKNAWVSSGRITTGNDSCFCVYETLYGQVLRFPFLLSESEGVDYLVACVERKTAASPLPERRGGKTYDINGKQYGIAYMVIGAVVFTLFSIVGIPMFLYQLSAGHWIVCLFFGIWILLPLSGVVKSILRYFFFRVTIESDRFYVRTNPFNGRYYAYSDITSCKKVLRIARHRRVSGFSDRSYFYFFVFTDNTGKTRKFLFQKDMHGHEIDALKKRIQRYTGCASTDEMDYGRKKAFINTIFSLCFILILVIAFSVLLFRGNGNSATPPLQQSVAEETQVAAPRFSDVHTVLYQKGFETANLPTTYWFIEESKLENVVSGRKGDTAFEYYQYRDDETMDLIFNQIVVRISEDLEPDERQTHITKLSGGNQLFTFVESGVRHVVVYKEDTLVYGRAPETSGEIQDILLQLGYLDPK